MSDPNTSTTWLGLSPAVLLALAGGLGAAISKAVGAVWRAIQKGNKDVADGLREQLAVERAERQRLSASLEKVGGEKDALRDQLEKERLRAAGVVYRVHRDPEVDDAVVEDMPTAVHERAKLLAGADPHRDWGANPHPEKPWNPTESTPPNLRPPRPRKS